MSGEWKRAESSTQKTKGQSLTRWDFRVNLSEVQKGSSLFRVKDIRLRPGDDESGNCTTDELDDRVFHLGKRTFLG